MSHFLRYINTKFYMLCKLIGNRKVNSQLKQYFFITFFMLSMPETQQLNGLKKVNNCTNKP